MKSVLIPLSTCDAAAAYLIKALGGEEFTKRVVGGTKWWQVRGMRGCVFFSSLLQDASLIGASKRGFTVDLAEVGHASFPKTPET